MKRVLVSLITLVLGDGVYASQDNTHLALLTNDTMPARVTSNFTQAMYNNNHASLDELCATTPDLERHVIALAAKLVSAATSHITWNSRPTFDSEMFTEGFSYALASLKKNFPETFQKGQPLYLETFIRCWEDEFSSLFPFETISLLSGDDVYKRFAPLFPCTLAPDDFWATQLVPLLTLTVTHTEDEGWRKLIEAVLIRGYRVNTLFLSPHAEQIPSLLIAIKRLDVPLVNLLLRYGANPHQPIAHDTRQSIMGYTADTMSSLSLQPLYEACCHQLAASFLEEYHPYIKVSYPAYQLYHRFAGYRLDSGAWWEKYSRTKEAYVAMSRHLADIQRRTTAQGQICYSQR